MKCDLKISLIINAWKIFDPYDHKFYDAVILILPYNLLMFVNCRWKVILYLIVKWESKILMR